jgi:hypothetical protein
MELSEIWKEWLDLFHKIDLDPEKYGIKRDMLAGPFLSTTLPDYDPGRHKAVMIVGRATHRDWYVNDFRAFKNEGEYSHERAINFLSRNTLHEIENNNNGDFFKFIKRISQQISRIDAIDLPIYQNIIWSNLAKIGVSNGNPKNTLLRAQVELARRTLLAEIEAYKPNLVIVTHGNYANCERTGTDIVHSVFDSTEDPWIEDDNRFLWYRTGGFGSPAIMLTDHPQNPAAKGHISFWVQIALSLIIEQA